MKYWLIVAVFMLAGIATGSTLEIECRSMACAPSMSLRAPISNAEPIADIGFGEFIILRTAQTLDCKAGLAWMTQLAVSGDAEAMFELGDMYETGSCAPTDESKALVWLHKAAEGGNVAAVGMIGKSYFLGNKRDDARNAKALLWLSRGAMSLDPRSFYYLGLMYLQGNGVRSSAREAYILFDVSMHLDPLWSEDRALALAARDQARERLTPAEVADAGSSATRLLQAMLQHQTWAIGELFPEEALAKLRASQ